jgi:LCP family protein required for cell wall assembly
LKEKKRMINWIDKHLKLLKIFVFSLAGITLLLGAGYLLIPWNQPLNQPLDLPPDPPTVTPSATPNPTATDIAQPTLVPSLTPTPTIVPVCGGPPVMHVLISGVASESYRYGLADAIRIARIDFQLKKVSVLALPRDLWVRIPGLEERDITVGKLNQAYFYGSEGMGYYSGGGYGSGLLAETLLFNYGYRAENYLAVNLNSFRRIIDAMGGIDVYLPYNVYRQVNEQPKLFLAAGYHHLYGEDAETLARQRITIGDFGRIDNQSIILRAVAAKLLSPAGIAALPSLANQLKSNVMTDFSPAEITQLICLAGKLDFKEDINFVTLPPELMEQQRINIPGTDKNTAALVGDEDEVRKVIGDFQAGIWP